MSEEIFDVVDANDQVIGQQPRSEVHRLGLRHRAIHLLVFNAKGELFLQKRSMKKKLLCRFRLESENMPLRFLPAI